MGNGVDRVQARFILRHAVKSQVLADFETDYMTPPCHPGGSDFIEPDLRASVFARPHWSIFFDGSS
jgi:hypothetical protein